MRQVLTDIGYIANSDLLIDFFVKEIVDRELEEKLFITISEGYDVFCKE